MANLLPNIELCYPGTKTLVARLIFRSDLEIERFKSGLYMAVAPISFMYNNILYWQKGKPFLFNNELLKFQPNSVNYLEWISFRQMYNEILELYKTGIIGTGERQMENYLIDQLNLPALENSLNEAVRVENYEAASRIRDKIKSIQDSNFKI